MKNIAKILCFVLSLVLIISVMGVSAFADESETYVAYTVDSNFENRVDYQTLSEAIKNVPNGGYIYLVADVTESIQSFTGVSIFVDTDVVDSATINNTYTENLIDFDNVTIGSGVTLNVNTLYSGGSTNSIDGTVNVAGDYIHGYDANTSIFGTLNVAGELSMANYTDSDLGISNFGTLECGTLAIHSGVINVYSAINCGKFVANNVNDLDYCADISVKMFDATIVANEVEIAAELQQNLYGYANGEGAYEIIIPVAMFNGGYYPTLQAAVDACVAGDNVVTLLVDDLDETVTVKQQANVNIVIDGEGHTFTGTFKLNGNKRWYGTETLTIKNINFYTYNDNHDFITYATKASNVHNLTVDGCTFTGTEYNKTGVRCIVLRTANKVTVKNCTATDVFNLVQNVSGSNTITVEGCTVDAMYGVNLNNAGGTNIISNNTFNASTGYAVNMESGNKGTASLEGNTIENGFVRVENTSTNELTVTITSDNVIPGVEIIGENVNVDLDDGYEFVGKEDGKFGIATQGNLPEIGEDGYWWVGEVNTGYKAVPEVTVNEEGYWVINGLPTEYRAVAINGVASTVEIRDFNGAGYWFINGMNTKIRAQAIDGVGVAKVEKNDALSNTNVSTFVITFTDGTTFQFTVNNGLDGNQGAPGNPGPMGPQGPIGAPGANGVDGADNKETLQIAIIVAGASVLLALIVLGCRVFKKDRFALPF